MGKTLNSIILRGVEYEIGNGAKDDNSEADFNISDENGNILAQFKNGHIKTKDFDSRAVNTGGVLYSKKYDGEKLDFAAEHTYKIEPFGTIENWKNSQGCAIYGNYLVSVMACDEMEEGVVNGYIHNIETLDLVSELKFGHTISEKSYNAPHANQVCFGNEFYNSNSKFPLLYVSQVNAGNGTILGEGGTLVYDLQGDDTNGYTPVLVQAIIPDLQDADLMSKIGKYTPNYIVDTDNNKLIVLGYPNATWFDVTGGTPVTVFNLPTIDDGSEVKLTNADCLDSYRINPGHTIQMNVYQDGKIYCQCGVGGSSNKIRVLDLALRKIVSEIDLSYRNGEPQGIMIWNNRLLWYDAGTSGEIDEFIFGN